MDTADLNLVLAAVLPDDALHERAEAHLQRGPRLLVPFSVGIELLLVCGRFGLPRKEALGLVEERFDVERPEVLYSAARSLDLGKMTTTFDAVHLADALHRRGALHTADQRLLDSPWPTVPF
ncbi:MAG: hypothetical protein KY455_00160 [Euryarchaeota archaeon]|nr:hypothetical protein [Euryarchaeota archaeon]